MHAAYAKIFGTPQPTARSLTRRRRVRVPARLGKLPFILTVGLIGTAALLRLLEGGNAAVLAGALTVAVALAVIALAALGAYVRTRWSPPLEVSLAAMRGVL